MGVVLLKNISLLFLLISASLLSSSFAGRSHSASMFASNSRNVLEAASNEKETAVKENGGHDKEDMQEIHERLLRANSRDYGTYDPAPALSKPPFKLIPN